jgi:transposase
MNNNVKPNNSEIRAEQVTKPQYEAIYLGCDLHKDTIMQTRIIDHAAPQPAQRLDWAQWFKSVQKQCQLAKKVYVVYEAGAFGFWPARQLKAMGVECYVAHPEKLDPRHKRVQTDRLDSGHLAERLQRYVLGNPKAMTPVYIPTEAEERGRLEGRHRRHLKQQLKGLQARGRGLLLSQGIFQTQSWWKEERWEQLQGQLAPELAAALGDDRALILEHEKLLTTAEKKLEAAAPKELPRGFGKLTFMLLLRELCNYARFKNRRNVGGFTGLCGGVSSSGPYHLDLSINKAGSPYVRTLLIELAWRVVYWQPKYKGLKVWRRFCGRGAGKVHARRRKIAIVALARQLAVDLWRWQTGQVSAEELGLQMLKG